MRLGTLTRSAARFLDASVVAGLNILVAGGTQTGKTTMLNCLSSAIPSRERVVTCGRSSNFRIHHPLVRTEPTGEAQRRAVAERTVE